MDPRSPPGGSRGKLDEIRDVAVDQLRKKEAELGELQVENASLKKELAGAHEEIDRLQTELSHHVWGSAKGGGPGSRGKVNPRSDFKKR